MNTLGRNQDTIVSHSLSPPIQARFVRIKSKIEDVFGDWALRFELLGEVCDSAGRKSCNHILTIYYSYKVLFKH